MCDDDYEYLGVHQPELKSSWQHCAEITRSADTKGYDSILLPSGYQLGIDSVAFAAGMATLTEQIRMLLAVRCGELCVPQMARQLATLDQMLGGRLTVNIISSDVPGETLSSPARYQRTREVMASLRMLLDGKPISARGEFVNLDVEPPNARTVSGRSPLFYFGGLSENARDVAAEAADVYLMWPDKLATVASLLTDMRVRAANYSRALRFGYRVHVIVREKEGEAIDASRRLLSRLDADEGKKIRSQSLDSQSVGVRAQGQLREEADADGFVEENLWTGIGRARSGCGAAVVGDPDQVLQKLLQYEAMGIDAFILSGYPHLDECDLFARYVLPNLDHSRLEGS
ncbi:MAG: LLM class flavin-dependent oxidoreductase [Pseudomonadales bacterium]|nr:LLM class flavin-dependent oxidoreductase [Pseudomonadales bacterium]